MTKSKKKGIEENAPSVAEAGAEHTVDLHDGSIIRLREAPERKAKVRGKKQKAVKIEVTPELLDKLREAGWEYRGYRPGYGYAKYGRACHSGKAPKVGILYRSERLEDAVKITVPASEAPRLLLAAEVAEAVGMMALAPGRRRALLVHVVRTGAPVPSVSIVFPASGPGADPRHAGPKLGPAPAPAGVRGGAPDARLKGLPSLPELARGDAGSVIERLSNGFGIDILDQMQGRRYDRPHIEIGFDTEYVEQDGARLILTYQMVVIERDGETGGFILREWVMFSLDGRRISRDQALAPIVRGLSLEYDFADYQGWWVHLPSAKNPAENTLSFVKAPRVLLPAGGDRWAVWERTARGRISTLENLCRSLPYEEEAEALLAPALMPGRWTRLGDKGRAWRCTAPKWMQRFAEVGRDELGRPYTYRGLLKADPMYEDDVRDAMDFGERVSSAQRRMRHLDMFPGQRASMCSVGYALDYSDVGRGEAGERLPNWQVLVTIVSHYGMADLSAFDDDAPEKDLVSRTQKVQGGLVTLRPMAAMIHLDTRYYSFQQASIEVRDTMAYAPEKKKSLMALGKAVGVPKIEIPRAWMARMDLLWERDPVLFCEYAVNDSVVCLAYAKSLFGFDRELPVTANGAAARVAREVIDGYMGCGGDKATFDRAFRGLVRIKQGVAHTPSGIVPFKALAPLSTDAATVMNMSSIGYHGGINGCTLVGHFPELTFDYDVQNAYPTGMALVVDIDWEAPILGEWRNRELSADDFDPELGPATPLLAEVRFEFPEGVYQPCIAVVAGQSLVFPRTSDGYQSCVATAPELWEALRLGASVHVVHAVRLRPLCRDDGSPSMALSAVVKEFVRSRSIAKAIFGKGSLAELLAKLGVNGNYGKVAQGVAYKAVYNAFTGEMVDLEGSPISSPYHASMITGIVRALLTSAMNELHDLGYAVYSVTTDGFITDAPLDTLEGLGLHGLADHFHRARSFLTDGRDPSIWAVKHAQDDLINFTTRGNVSLHTGGEDSVLDGLPGVCAHNSFVTGEEKESREDRAALALAVTARTSRVRTCKDRPTEFRALTARSGREDFGLRAQTRSLSMDFDLKRRPVRATMRDVEVSVDGQTHRMARFDTEPWESVSACERGKGIARDIADCGGCLRTVADWERWFLRMESDGPISARDPAWTYVRAAVTAYRLGLREIAPLAALDTGRPGSVSKVCAWVNRFVPAGSKHRFTRDSWKDARKLSRSISVPDELFADILEAMRADDPGPWLSRWE